MSARREKKVRRIARKQYKVAYAFWYLSKPPKWRIFQYLKWKKAKPVYRDFEKHIREGTEKNERERF